MAKPKKRRKPKKLKKRRKSSRPPRPPLALPRDTEEHPLIIGMRDYIQENNTNLRVVALKQLGVTQQALYDWWLKASKNRDFEIPPRRIAAICKLTGQPPYLYNPELWTNPKWVLR